jgi:hypothetical protein
VVLELAQYTAVAVCQLKHIHGPYIDTNQVQLKLINFEYAVNIYWPYVVVQAWLSWLCMAATYHETVNSGGKVWPPVSQHTGLNHHDYNKKG